MRFLFFIVFILLFFKYSFALEVEIIAPQENKIENVIYKDTILPIVLSIYDDIENIENEIKIKVYKKDKIVFEDKVKNENKEIIYKIDLNIDESFQDITDLNIFIIGNNEAIIKKIKLIYDEELLNNLAKKFINDYCRYKGKILKIKNYPILIYTQNQFLDIITEAIKFFEKYCNLKILIIDDKKNADIIIKDMSHIVMLDRLADCEYILVSKDLHFFYIRNVIHLYSFFHQFKNKQSDKHYFNFAVKIVSHELGHAIGINSHTKDYSIMNPMNPINNGSMILYPYQQQAIKILYLYNK
jgi:hypothetical protein